MHANLEFEDWEKNITYGFLVTVKIKQADLQNNNSKSNPTE